MFSITDIFWFSKDKPRVNKFLSAKCGEKLVTQF